MNETPRLLREETQRALHQPCKPCVAPSQGLRHYEEVPLGKSQEGEEKKQPEPVANDTEGKDNDDDDAFPAEYDCLMIFGGPDSYASKRLRKLEHREVYAMDPSTPNFLKWSDTAITFDRIDHPDHVP